MQLTLSQNPSWNPRYDAALKRASHHVGSAISRREWLCRPLVVLTQPYPGEFRSRGGLVVMRKKPTWLSVVHGQSKPDYQSCVRTGSDLRWLLWLKPRIPRQPNHITSQRQNVTPTGPLGAGHPQRTRHPTHRQHLDTRAPATRSEPHRAPSGSSRRRRMPRGRVVRYKARLVAQGFSQVECNVPGHSMYLT